MKTRRRTVAELAAEATARAEAHADAWGDNAAPRRGRLDHAEAIADALGYDLDVRFVLRHAPDDTDGEP